MAFDAGESIWTESSYKYEIDEVVRLGSRAGFVERAVLVDNPGRFALTLFEAQA